MTTTCYTPSYIPFPFYPTCTSLEPRPRFSRAGKIVISAFFASSFVRNNIFVQLKRTMFRRLLARRICKKTTAEVWKTIIRPFVREKREKKENISFALDLKQRPQNKSQILHSCTLPTELRTYHRSFVRLRNSITDHVTIIHCTPYNAILLKSMSGMDTAYFQLVLTGETKHKIAVLIPVVPDYSVFTKY